MPSRNRGELLTAFLACVFAQLLLPLRATVQALLNGYAAGTGNNDSTRTVRYAEEELLLIINVLCGARMDTSSSWNRRLRSSRLRLLHDASWQEH